MYKHFIFDIDGTIIDTESTATTSLHQTILDLMGVDVPLPELRRYFSMPSNKVGGELGYHDPKAFHDYWDEQWDVFKHVAGPFEGMPELVEKVHELGYSVGCVTSRSPFEIDYDEHLKPIMEHFDVVITSEDTSKHKPDPEPIRLWMKKLSEKTGEPVLPSDCIYLGDTMADCLCAQNAGVHFALADWCDYGLQGMNPEYHFKSPKEFSEFVINNSK